MNMSRSNSPKKIDYLRNRGGSMHQMTERRNWLSPNNRGRSAANITIEKCNIVMKNT